MGYDLFEVRVANFIFNDKNELFLLKNDVGTWGILGGHLDKGEQIIDTVHREAMEEANIKIKIVKQLGNRVVKNSFIIAFACKYISGEINLQEEEVTDYKWVKISELKKYNLTFKEIPLYAKEALGAIKELKEISSEFLKELLSVAKKEGIEKIVVAAVIKDGNKVLLLERPKDDFMGGINELPSGNMESGENIKEALIRELKEETNLDFKNFLKYLGVFDYSSGSKKKVRQFNFLIEVVKNGEVKITEHKNYVWAEKENKAFTKVTANVKNILNKL